VDNSLITAEALALQKLPPQNLELEQAILGGILLDNQALPKVLEVLHAQDFYKAVHRTLFLAMLALDKRGEPVDLLTLTDYLRNQNQLEAVGGATHLAEIINAVSTSMNLKSYATLVHQKALLRLLIHTANDIVERCYTPRETLEDLLDAAEKQIFAITDQNIRSAAFVPMKNLVKTSFEMIERLAEKQITGLSTGWADLDNMTSGLQPADLIIVAGRPSMGKTAFAMCLAQHISIVQQQSVGVFSLEMSKEQLALRMLCSESRVDAHKVRTGHLGRPGNDNWRALIDGAGRLNDAPIFIDDSASLSIFEMRAKARRLRTSTPLGLIVVDYLQLMRGHTDADNREREIAEISRSLKGLAKELQVPVVALSQLNRAVETRDKKRPILADLRESGAIEQDADVVFFIHRQEVYQPCTCPLPGECACGRRGVAEIIIGKQRNGPTGTVKLAFIDRYTRFENLDQDHPARYAG